MPQPLTELFNGGLVTARHPALLRPGELQRADDCVYRQNDPAIWRAPGRTQYGTVVSGSPTLGLASMPFENGLSSKILAFAGTTLYSLPVAFTGTETSTEMSGPGNITGTVAIVSTHSEFTADNGEKPFLPEAVGARVRSGSTTADSNIVVVEVKGTPTNGRYPTVVLKQINGDSVQTIFTAGSYTIIFEWGCVQTFQLATDSRDDILDLAQYGASYFVWTGGQAPVRVGWMNPPSISGVTTSRFLAMRGVGLDPVIERPTSSMLTGTIPNSNPAASYAWPPTLTAGYFWFLFTEIYTPPSSGTAQQDNDEEAREVESAYLAPDEKGRKGIPVPVLFSDLARGVRWTMPAPVNIGGGGRISTHWGIYMAPLSTTDKTDIPALATFRRVKKEAINRVGSGQTIDLYENLASQSFFASATAAGEGQTNFASASQMVGGYDAVWTGGNPDRCGIAKTQGTDAPGTDDAVTELTFPLSVTAPFDTPSVTGIHIAVRGRASSSGNAESKCSYYLYFKNSAKRSITLGGTFDNNQFQIHNYGGANDTHGVSWGAGSGLGTFRVVIGIVKEAAKKRLNIDAAYLTVYYASTSLNLQGKAYRVVVYRDQIGTSVHEPAAGTPPSCSTGDFFGGSLVVNNTADETAIHYSLPGKPEFFPRPYVMRFNTTKRRDKVTCIRSLGQILIVGMDNSIKRVNYLPREVNTDLTDGLAQEDLGVDHGIAGSLAAVKFDFPGMGTVLAYASPAGMFLTNGVWTRPLNLDLDWPNTVKLSALSSCVLRVYPREKWLELYYCPAGASHNRNTRKLIFSYAMDKIKEGGFLPCVGPITVSGRAVTELNTSGTSYIITGHETSGLIYLEDSGTTQATGYQVHNASDSLADAPIQPLIRTRKIYAAGIERDSREERIYLLFSSYGSTVSATSDTVLNDLTVSSSNAFGSVVVGMRVTGAGIDPGTIVTAKASNSSITISRAANATGTGVSLTFDTGTLAVTVRGSSIGEAVATLDTSYVSTLTGDLVVAHNDNTKQALELQVEKVVLPNGTSVDLGVNMRLHQFTILMNDQGMEQNRSAA